MTIPENIPQVNPADVWAAIYESSRMIKEMQAENARLIKDLTEKQSETDRLINESRKELKEKQAENDRLLNETSRFLTEKQSENDRLINESRKELKEKQSETDIFIKELKESQLRLSEKLGGMANSHGSFAEEYFYNSFDRGERVFFGEKFDEITKGLKYRSKKIEVEYDVVLYNCSSVAIIEVKYKAHENDLPKILKKIDTFRYIYPDYQNYKIYLGIASMAFYPELEQECIKNGIAIIKQVGGEVVIEDGHRKTF